MEKLVKENETLKVSFLFKSKVIPKFLDTRYMKVVRSYPQEYPGTHF
jgi:hypothetical protein